MSILTGLIFLQHKKVKKIKDLTLNNAADICKDITVNDVVDAYVDTNLWIIKAAIYAVLGVVGMAGLLMVLVFIAGMYLF